LRQPITTLFPYRRSSDLTKRKTRLKGGHLIDPLTQGTIVNLRCDVVFMSLFPFISFAVPLRSNGEVIGHLHLESGTAPEVDYCRSEEHTSELQSRGHLVC